MKGTSTHSFMHVPDLQKAIVKEEVERGEGKAMESDQTLETQLKLRISTHGSLVSS